MGRHKLLLVNPIQWLEGRRQQGWNGNRFVPPLSLAYVAASTPDHWEICLVDENGGQDATQTRGFVPDLVGITAYTATIPRAYTLAKHFRKRGIPVVIGGSHASAVPEETVLYADVAFVGQAEGAWPQLLEDFEQGQLRSRYDGGTPSLEGLAWPRRDLYPRRYLFDAVVTSKGCPYRCEFCSVWKTYGKRYRLRPVDEVLDELAGVTARYVFFVDDNLTFDAKRSIELCKGMVERRLNKRFAVQASLEACEDDELLHWLARAGCFLIFVGIESVDEVTLQHLRKASNLRVGVDHFAECIARVHSQGMALAAGVIFGNDADTPDTFGQLQDFVLRSGIDSPVYTILTPLPGTDLWDRLQAEGRMLVHAFPEGYALFDAHHVVFEPKKVTAGELLAANRQAVRRFTSAAALLGNLWRTWRRTGSPLASLACYRNSRWAGINARSP
jgi:radical SAM superfamily enzyme YgiQ (UPF0313 family)